jgi:hypothetical protein
MVSLWVDMRQNDTRALLAEKGPEPVRKSSMIVPAGTMGRVEPPLEARSSGPQTVPLYEKPGAI